MLYICYVTIPLHMKAMARRKTTGHHHRRSAAMLGGPALDFL